VSVAPKSLWLIVTRCVRFRISADLHDEARIEPSSFTRISPRIAEYARLSDVVVAAVVKVAVYPECRLRIEDKTFQMGSIACNDRIISIPRWNRSAGRSMMRYDNRSPSLAFLK